MIGILTGINWTAVIVTLAVCVTAIRGIDGLRRIMRTWLTGIQTRLEIEKEITGRWKR